MSDRFPLVGAPVQPPGCCLACRRGSDPLGFFDLGTLRGFELAGDQVAYLCVSSCLLELVRALGYQPPETVDRLQRLERESSRARLGEQARGDALERVVVDGMLAMLERITMARLRLEMEGLGDGGPDAGDPAAGGGDGGGGAGGDGDGAGGAAEPDGGAPPGPGARRAGRARRPAAGAAAGPAGDG